jgi:hypothetical protein
MPGWGAARTIPQGVVLTPEQMRNTRNRAIASRNLADRVRDYIRRPTTGNQSAMEAALANYDEVTR